MKCNVLFSILVSTLLLFPKWNFGQAPALGTAANYALFTSVGAVTNSGITYITKVTGNVGTNSAPTITGFGNVDGQMHFVGDPSSTQCDADLLLASNALTAAIPDSTIGVVIGNGDTLKAGIYLMPGVASLNGDIYLDAQNNPNAVFIFKTLLAFSSSANAKVHLINGALACNVFWKLNGAVTLGTGTFMRGTIISGGGISLTSGDTLEGRALTINGAILTNDVLVYTPTGCGSPLHTGPIAPPKSTTACYALFTSIGPLTDDGQSFVTGGGDIGNNGGGLTTGFDPLKISGASHIHVGDGSTAQAATDFNNTYAYLNGLAPGNIQLLYPAQFGHSLVLTPHSYLMLGAVTFTDTVYLNAEGYADAVFIILVNGAFSTSTYSKVILINGAQAKNVFWKIDGAVDINDYSVFNGTIISQGAINLQKGVVLNGRAQTGVGAVATFAMTVNLTPGCGVPPTDIITQPINQSACAGDSVSFVVKAVGTGIAYQWRKGTTNLINGLKYSGVDSDSLTVNAISTADTASNYNVVISGGPDTTSQNVSLTLNSISTILTEPIDQIICAAGTTSFTVGPKGTGLTYQWRKGTVDLINAGNISGVDSTTLTINPVNTSNAGLNYNVVVSGFCSVNDTSKDVLLIVNTSSTVTVEPISKIACTGDTVLFIVAPATAGLTYQWRKGNTSLLNGLKNSGVTNDTLKIFNVVTADTASNYNVIISGSCSPDDTSKNVSLIINSSSTITTEPSNQVTCGGTNVIFTVAPIGIGLTYQWRIGNVDLIDGIKFIGVKTATLTINAATISDTASNYNVIIKGTCTPNDTSKNVSLTFSNDIIISTEPVDQTACIGDSVSFSVAAIGVGLTYQWRKGIVNLINGVKISGADSATLTINAVDSSDVSSDYSVLISGTCSTNDSSINVILIVNTAPEITSQPTNQTACLGDSVSFSVIATGVGLTYQWRTGITDLTSGGNILDATSATLVIYPVTISDTASNYNVVISGGCLPNKMSENVSLKLNTPNIITQPANTTACAGDSISFSTIATGTGLTYQWRNGNADVVNDVRISGSTTATLTINPTQISDSSSNYYVIVKGTCSPNDSSVKVSLILNSAIVVTTKPVNQVACIGASISFSTIATGTGLTYQWRKGNADVVNDLRISGSTTATLTINPTQISDSSSNYYVIVKGTCSPNDSSTKVSLTFSSAIVITTKPANQVACLGTSISFSTVATGAGLTYQWRKGNADVVNDLRISGSTTATLTINPTQISDSSSNYYVIVKGTCSTNDTSKNVSLKINTSTLITSEPANQKLCGDQSAIFSVIATGTGLTYQWRKGTVNLMNGIEIIGATTATLTLSPANISDTASNYNVLISGTCGLSVTSKNVVLSIISLPIVTAVNSIIVCKGNAINLTSAAVTSAGYIWTGPNGFTSTIQNPIISSALITDAGTYSLIISLSGCNSTPSTVLVTVNNCDTVVVTVPLKIPEGFSPSGDGINDEYVIRGIENYPNNSIVIFNRWGDKVFDAKPYQNNWDGSSTKGLSIGGHALPIGTYFYLLDLGDKSPVIKGSIYLVR